MMTYVRTYLMMAVYLCVGGVPAYAGWDVPLGNALQGLGLNGVSQSHAVQQLTQTDMVGGLKDALRIGSEHVVSRLSRKNGFQSDAKVHIPLPKQVQQAQTLLTKFGMGKIGADLELRLNRAAEAATPKAKRLFVEAIQKMRFEDAKQILEGSDDAATRYFQRQMTQPLAKDMRPIVSQALSQVGALRMYDQMMGKYQSLPFVPNVHTDLTQYVVDQALHGIFRYMGEEEAGIRHQPIKRTTELLKKIF